MNLLQTQKVLATIQRIQRVRNEPGLMNALRKISDRQKYDPDPSFEPLSVTSAFLDTLDQPTLLQELVPYKIFITHFLENVDEYQENAAESILTAGDSWSVSRSAAEIYRAQGIEPRVYSLDDERLEYKLAVDFVFDEDFKL